MCAIRMGVPGGKPLRLTTNVTCAAVMLPDESRVTSNVIVELPVPVASAPVIGGFSFDVFRRAENVGFGCEDGDEAVSLVQADATHASAIAVKTKRVIVSGSLSECVPARARQGPAITGQMR